MDHEPFVFKKDQRVIKRKGDYIFRGVILACFRKLSGAPRYAAENADGVVHIFNAQQLEPDESE